MCKDIIVQLKLKLYQINNEKSINFNTTQFNRNKMEQRKQKKLKFEFNNQRIQNVKQINVLSQ